MAVVAPGAGCHPSPLREVSSACPASPADDVSLPPVPVPPSAVGAFGASTGASASARRRHRAARGRGGDQVARRALPGRARGRRQARHLRRRRHPDPAGRHQGGLQGPLPGHRPDADRGLQQVPRRPGRQPVRHRHPRPGRRAAPDVQDFVRWKQQGRLLPYKPAGFSKVYDAFKDPQGAWVASARSPSASCTAAAVGSDAPRTPLRPGRPEVEGQDRLVVPARRRRGPLPLLAVRPDVRLGLGGQAGRSGRAVRARQQLAGRRRLRRAEGDRYRHRRARWPAPSHP